MLNAKVRRKLLPVIALALATALGGCVVYPGYGGGYGWHGGYWYR